MGDSIGALPTGGYSGAGGGVANQGGGGFSECFVFGLFLLACASEKQKQQEENDAAEATLERS
jgi:hypothetical protein